MMPGIENNKNIAVVPRDFCAVHESGSGPSRHFGATEQFSRFWSEADIQQAALIEPE
jgi:hypothetical protein